MASTGNTAAPVAADFAFISWEEGRSCRPTAHKSPSKEVLFLYHVPFSAKQRCGWFLEEPNASTTPVRRASSRLFGLAVEGRSNMCEAAAVRQHYCENRLAQAGEAVMAATRSIFITSVLDNLIQSTPSVTRETFNL